MLNHDQIPVIQDVVEAVALSEGLPEAQHEPALDAIRRNLVQRGLHPLEARRVLTVAGGVWYGQKKFDTELENWLGGRDA
jgi:hypothetical protein